MQHVAGGGDMGLAGDIMAALRLVGCLGEEEVQGHVDNILNVHQEREGLVATICHQSDGLNPSKVFSLVPGRAQEGRLEPSTWEQLMEGCLPGGAQGGLEEAQR